MVSSRCYTYNQAQYVEDTLKGFAIQETSFPAVFIIVDDASTDGEQEVLYNWVNENLEAEDGGELWKGMFYGQLAEGKLKGNNNSTFVVLLLAENHYQKGIGKKRLDYIAEWNEYAKYKAACEGDDFWIDSKKLLKQVDYMENHQNCSLLYTNFYAKKSDGCKEIEIPFYNYKMNVERLIIDAPFLAPCTWLMRDYGENINYPRFIVGDLPLLLEYARRGRIDYLEDKTSVYRVLENSASHIKDSRKRLEFRNGMLEIKKYYCKLFQMPAYVLEECTIKSYRLSILDSIKTRNIEYLSMIVPYLYRNIKKINYVEKILLIIGYILIKINRKS